MKKIQPWATQDGKFHLWALLDSDLTQDAKILFLVLYHLPSKIMPPSEELRTYASMKRNRMRRSLKELELRGCLEFASGLIVLKDRVNAAPPGEVLPLPKSERKEATTEEFNAFKTWYLEQYMARNSEPYPFAGGKDGMAIHALLKAYGLEGSKKKAIDAWEGADKFFKTAANSISALSSIASRLVNAQIVRHQITDPKKWEGQKATEMKL